MSLILAWFHARDNLSRKDSPMNMYEEIITELIETLESARNYLDPSPIIQGKIDEAIQRAKLRVAEEIERSWILARQASDIKIREDGDK